MGELEFVTDKHQIIDVQPSMVEIYLNNKHDKQTLCKKLLTRCLYPTAGDETLLHKDRPELMQAYQVIYFDQCYDLDLMDLSENLMKLISTHRSTQTITELLNKLIVYRCPSPMACVMSICHLDDYLSLHPQIRFIILDGHEMALSSPFYFLQSLQFLDYLQKKYSITVLILHHMKRTPHEWQSYIDRKYIF